MAFFSGLAILGASLLLIWACDAAQADICQALAMALVALLAVLPEYSVDMYFTWHAGLAPEGPYAHYAIANMTGANRLLIGVAWAAIAVLYWVRHRRPAEIHQERRLELGFMGLATAYALIIPIKGSLAWYDGLVFLSIYGGYIRLASQRSCVEVEADGPAELLVALPKIRRRFATGTLFLVAAGAIFANAKPFCEGLIATGKLLQINEFLLVQWLAPIASEAPEFTVSLIFAWRGQASLALGTLLSAKLNQWTLLVGMIPGVFGVAHGSFDHPIPLSPFQFQEILLTAAQSLMAVVLLTSFKLPLSAAALLFGLFAGQLVLPPLLETHPDMAFGLTSSHVHPLFTALYFVAALALFLHAPKTSIEFIRSFIQDLRPAKSQPAKGTRESCHATTGHPLPRCMKCPWRHQGMALCKAAAG